MTTQSDVNKFLGNFKKIVSERGIDVVQREKNLDTLTELGLTNIDVQNEILRLDATDYIDGPKPDREFPGDVWEFGKTIHHEEIYIKLKLRGSTQAVCISFHHAEDKISYPFK